MRRRTSLPLALLVLALGASSASAQGVITSTRAEPYVPLAAIPGIQDVTPLSFTNVNTGQVVVSGLPFAFNYFGTSYTRVNLGANGILSFGTEPATSSSNQVPGTNGLPANWIAPLWDDLVHPTAQNARWGVVGSAPNRAMVFEAGPASRDGGTGGTLMYQVWLFEGVEGHFEYKVTGEPGTASLNATIGFEAVDSTIGVNAAGCAPANVCTTVPDGVTFTGERRPEPDLSGVLTGLPRGARPGETLPVSLTLRNLGIRTATAVLSTVYLSTDNQLDASDPIMGSSGPSDVLGDGVVTTSMPTLTVPAGLPLGDHFVILQVDSAEEWTEPNEANNVVVLGQRFANAAELRPTRIAPRGSAGGQPGGTVELDLALANSGAPQVGPLAVRLYLSDDRRFDETTDLLLGDASVELTGATSQNAILPVTLPATLPLGRYYPIVVVDPDAAIDEITENNNVSISSSQLAVGVDFTLALRTVPTSAAPGERPRIITRIDSTGATYTGPIDYELWLSTDDVLDTADFRLGAFSLAYAGQNFIDDTQTPTITPGLPPGRYRLIARVDPGDGLVEIDETNNLVVSSGSMLSAVDLAVDAPTFRIDESRPGGTSTVTTTLRSLGLTFTGTVSWRVHLSLDSTLGPGDLRVHEGEVWLDRTSLALSAVIRVPAEVEIRSYRVLVEVDAAGQYAEADETNNVAASTSVIAVEGPDLRLVSVDSASVAIAGEDLEVAIEVVNDGAAPAGPFGYAILLSENEFIRVTDTLLEVGTATGAAVGQSRRFVHTVRLPTRTTTASLHLGAIVDVGSEVRERSEANNLGRRAEPILVGVRRPNPSVLAVDGPDDRAGPGEMVRVRRVLQNDGDAPVEVELVYRLTPNETLSAADPELLRRTVRLEAGATDTATDTVRLPDDVAPGRYRIGLVLDPDDRLDERREDDNARLGPSLEVRGPGLRILSRSLPSAVRGEAWAVALVAVGAESVGWSLASGTLPEGLSLEPSGRLAGTPGAIGVFAFTVRATAGPETAEQALELRVLASAAGLEITSLALPTGVVGEAYSAQLEATGGVAPLSWSVTGALPAGLTLSSAGVLAGTPSAAGVFELTLRVEDGEGSAAEAAVAIAIDAAAPPPSTEPEEEGGCGCASLPGPARGGYSGAALGLLLLLALGRRRR